MGLKKMEDDSILVPHCTNPPADSREDFCDIV